MAVKRRGPLARLLLALAVFLLCLVGWGGWRGMHALLGSELFTLRFIEVTGCRVLPVDMVRERLEPLLGRPLHTVSPDSLESELADLPRVRGVRVSRRLPGTLRCRIEEAEPVALFYDDAFRELDAAGEVLPRFGDSPPDLPIIRPSEKLHTDSLQVLALAALAALRGEGFDLASEVSEISAEAPGIVYYRSESSTRVILGWEDFALRASCYRDVYAELAARDFPRELDLRYRDQVIAR